MFWVICVLAVLVDQVTKAAVRASLVPGQPQEFIPGVLDLSFVKNTGAAFSIGEGAGPVFIFVTVGIVVSVILYLVMVDAPASAAEASARTSGAASSSVGDRQDA